MVIVVIFSMCMTASAASDRSCFEGQYDNLADWPELRIYADNLTFTQDKVQQYLSGNTMEEEIAKAVRSVVVLDNGFSYEKGFALIDASDVKAEPNAFGYEVRLYLTTDTSKEYIPITLFVTGSTAQPQQTVPPTGGATQTPSQSEQETVAPNETQNADTQTPCEETIIEPEQQTQITPPPATNDAGTESEDTGMSRPEQTSGFNMPKLLEITGVGSFAISGLVWLITLPEIVSGLHVLAWYKKKKKENAGHSHSRAI